MIILGACGRSAEDVASPAGAAPASPDAGPVSDADPAGDTLGEDGETDGLETAASEPAAPPRVMVVMDSSGSMWGQIDGVSKRDIGRAALREMLGALPEESKVGLVAYGHRRTGDCTDIELLARPGETAATELAGRVDALRPLGNTPLMGGVLAAADTLGTEPGTIIAITDGIETCVPDVCATARQMAASRADVRVHVVGFGLSERDGRAVSCIADETGGRYLEARDAAGLGRALGEVVRTVAQAERAAEVATPAASLTAPASVEIGTVFDVRWQGPDAQEDFIQLFQPASAQDQPGREITYAWIRDGQPGKLQAPVTPGDYLLRYIWEGPAGRRVAAERAITFVDVAAAVAPPRSVEVGERFEVSWRGPGGREDYIDIAPASRVEPRGYISFAMTSDGSPASLQAPGQPGDYKVRYIASGTGGERVLAEAPLVVSPATVELAFAPTTTLGARLDVFWAGPGNDGDYIAIVPKGAGGPGGERSFAYTRSANPVTLTLPGTAGEYEVRYVLAATGGAAVLASEPLNLGAAAVSLNHAPGVQGGGQLEVSWQGPDGQGDYIAVVPKGFAGNYVSGAWTYTSEGSPLQVRVPAAAGEYEVRYVLEAAGGATALLSRPLQVTAPTASLEAPATAAPGAVVRVNWRGPGGGSDYIDIVERGAEQTSTQLGYTYTASGNPAELTVPGAPGSYDIRYILEAPDGRLVLARKPLTVR